MTGYKTCHSLLNAVMVAIALMSLAALAKASDSPPAADTASPPPDPALKLIVSLADQRIDLYRGLELIESGPVSSGKEGHATPAGIYSILQKRKWHRSNLYSAAPMPHMQRITWSGIALHAGRLPGYPASHGCIRLEKDFARNLFSMTKLGADVIVVPEATEPRPIEHELLRRLSSPQPGAETRVASLGPVGEAGNTGAMRLADTPSDTDIGHVEARRPGSPLRMLITWRKGRQRMMDVQSLLAELGHEPGDIDGYMGRSTSAAIVSFQQAHGLLPTGAFSDQLVDALYQAAGREPIEGHLYVRRDHRDLFDVPILIDDPATSLGTHMLTSLPTRDDVHSAAWSALTLKEGDAGLTAEAALSRVNLSAAIRGRLATLLTPDSTLIISDQGLGRETGKGTDFIVQLQ